MPSAGELRTAQRRIRRSAWNRPRPLRGRGLWPQRALSRSSCAHLRGELLHCQRGGNDGSFHSAKMAPRNGPQKVGVVLFLYCRGCCLPLRAVFPPLQVVLSSACSVASLSRFPSHYLPGHLHLREGALAAYPFGKGNPSTWCAGRAAVRNTPSTKLPYGAQRGITLPR